MSKIETVARAICHEHGEIFDALPDKALANDGEVSKAYFLMLAAAAIEAMGGPEEPMTYQRVGAIERGMPLRDHFAGQALTSGEMVCPKGFNDRPDKIASRAYDIADAMLAEREKRQS